MKTTETIRALLKHLLLLALLLNGEAARAQVGEAAPEVRVLTYANVAYAYAPGYQDWAYPDGNRHGGGYTLSYNATSYSRYGGGQITNYWAWNSYESGYGGGAFNVYDETRNSTLWYGACPATATIWNYRTNANWSEGMDGPATSWDQSFSTDTNWLWEPGESRKALNITFQPDWTLEFDWGLPHLGCYYKRTNYTAVDTTLELFAGGATNSTEDVTMLVNASVYDNLRGRYLTWNEFTVAGRTPSTNNNIFFLMLDNQRTNLTFTFSPTNALPTNALPGSYDYSFWAWPARHHHFAAVDRNGDGSIDFTGTNDLTSAGFRYLFWVNNDYELFHQSSPITGDLYYEFDDVQTTANGATDFLFDYIHNERDLEDFTRLHIQVPIPFADTNWGVRIKGGDLKLFGGTDGTLSYLTDVTTGAALVGTNGAEFLGRTGAGPVWIPGDRFDGEQQFHLLFEAGQAGDATLEVELVWQGQVVGNSRVWLKLLDVKSMYDQWVVGDLEDATPSTDYLPAFAASHAGSIDPAVLAQLTGATNYVLFVHGWNMLMWEKQAFAETAFKRLWWQGYRGRYGAFRWPTYHMGLATVFSTLVNYDCSEYNSWKSAIALENLLVYLNDTNLCAGNVRVMAHSMGNVVAGEALRRLRDYRLPGTDQPYVRNYLALQGAIPAHAYDGSVNHNIDFLPYVVDNLTPNRYAMYWRDTNGPYFSGPSGAGTYKNYTNPDDYALEKWVFDQQTKPDESLGYWYSPAAATLPQNSGIRRGILPWMRELFWPDNPNSALMADTHEAFAFGIEPRSSALGASLQVQGLFAGNELNLQAPPFRFAKTHDYHSKQFRSTIALQWGFWNTVLTDFGF